MSYPSSLPSTPLLMVPTPTLLRPHELLLSGLGGFQWAAAAARLADWQVTRIRGEANRVVMCGPHRPVGRSDGWPPAKLLNHHPSLLQ
jgi:hypothetical protein